MPARIAPMLCTLTREPVNNPLYLYEIKWDGYRIMSYCSRQALRMESRSALDYTAKYPPVANALKLLKRDLVVDGEVVVFNEQGIPDFDALQLYNGHTSPIHYCLFDLLWLDGYNLMHLPLTERKDMLKNLIAGDDVLKYSESYDDGEGLYQLMLEKNLEGIVAKKRTSQYIPGQRGNEWLKTPTRKRQEFVIGGWAESSNGRAFKSLLFGAYENKKLTWIGRSGGGYKEKEMPGILKKLKSLETDESPFANPVLDTKGAVTHWVKPELVANFEFATWTKSGRIRKPATFLGFREDKKSKQVVREVPTDPTDSNWPEVERQSKKDATTLEVDDCSIDLYDVDRQIWKGINKGDLIQYYHRIADVLLPHIYDRPQSLHLKLHGANAPGLYIKDMEGRQPDCADIFRDSRRHQVPGKRSVIDYLVCNNEPTLLWMINLGCIDVNPWHSRIKKPDQPDYVVIDLDPSEKRVTPAGLNKLRKTALATKQFCDEHKLKTFAKTSGKTGIHFLIPCSGFSYAESRKFAEFICSAIHEYVPDESTTENSIAKRGKSVYIDPSQNDYADTIAAAYTVRPYSTPLVSTPLDPKEINLTLDTRSFTMDTIFKRLSKSGDLFERLHDKSIALANNRQLKKL